MTLLDKTIEERYSDKENYVTDSPYPNVWRWHLNADLINETTVVTGNSIADFGCNHGACTILMAEYGKKVVGFDLNEKALSVARKTLSEYPEALRKNVQFKQSFFTKLDIADDEFDGGYMLDVFEHLFPDTRKAIFAEISRVMRENAKLVIVTPYGNASDHHTHVDYFDEDKLRSVLEDLGLHVENLARDQRTDLKGDGNNRINALCTVNKTN